MPQKLIYRANIAPSTAPMEVSYDGGTTFVALAFATVGSLQEATLANVPAATYAIGKIVMRCVGYPATTVSNAAALTVVAAAAAGPTFIFFEGDSNTNGGEGTTTAPYFTTADHSFFKLITARLGSNYATFNAGTGGGTSTSRAVDLASRFNAAWTTAGKTAFPNAILYWMSGTNDPASGVTLAQAQTAISGLRGQMDSISAGIKIVLSSAIEPTFHQNGPTGQVYFQQLADWESANWNGSLGAAAYYNLRGNPELNRLVSKSQAAGWSLAQNEDNFSLEMFGGVNGTGNTGDPFDSSHWGNFGHELYAQALLPIIQTVATGVTPSAVPRPAPPTFGAIDDTANTVTLIPATGVPLALYRYRLPGALTEYALPTSGIIPVGNLAGKVVAYSVYGNGFGGSEPGSSTAFTVASTGPAFAVISFNAPSISENPTYANAYSTVQTAASGPVPNVPFRSVGWDPLLWYKHTSTKGGRLRWPVAQFFGNGNPPSMTVVLDGVTQSSPYPIVDNQVVFDFPFSDGATHTILWYPTSGSQNNFYQFEQYT